MNIHLQTILIYFDVHQKLRGALTHPMGESLKKNECLHASGNFLKSTQIKIIKCTVLSYVIVVIWDDDIIDIDTTPLQPNRQQ